jgi:hypothetical protein
VGTVPSTLVNWGERKGWNEVFNDGAASDQAFLSRQDLIAFQRANASVFPPSLLPYFTHANFSLNQSSHAPDPQRPLVTAAGASAVGRDNAFNPSHLSVRSAIPAEINAATRPTVPVTARRFPLDRLNLVKPNPADPARVRQYFGLIYKTDPNGDYWEYEDNAIQHLDASTSTGLVSVKSENREPNFAELLMSTLHVGSLGSWGNELDTMVKFPLLSDARSITFHTLQLMANIIDQWDADSLPTVIVMNVGTPDPKRIVGIEDLPRLYGILGVCHRMEVLPTSSFITPPPLDYGQIYRSVYLQRPHIWNPHQPSPNPSAFIPTSFRVVATTGLSGPPTAADIRLTFNDAPDWLGVSPNTNNLSPVGHSDLTIPNGDRLPWGLPKDTFITFNTSLNPANPASFRNPYVLRSPNYPAGSNASGNNSTNPSFINNFSKLNPTEFEYTGGSSTNAIGFVIGEIWTSDNAYKLDPSTTHIATGIRYDLQYQNEGSWITYDQIFTEPTWSGCRVSYTPQFACHFHHSYKLDPRTIRMSVYRGNHIRAYHSTWGNVINEGQSLAPFTTNSGAMLSINSHPVHPSSLGSLAVGLNILNPYFFQRNIADGNGAFSDPDMIVRPAMGANAAGATGFPNADPTAAIANSRPVILNRPFRSVAELGYVFRDQPWKQFDLNNPSSADGALLEAFCLHSDPVTYEAPRITRGRINPNTASPEVMAALFQGTAKVTGSSITASEALELGKELNTWVSTPANRSRSKAEIIGKTVNGTSTGFTQRISNVLNATDRTIHERREAVIRALADSSDTRTWNLMLDVVAQAGQLINSATDLNQFNVRGQTHRWVFLSIDRMTGEILHQSSEFVTE